MARSRELRVQVVGDTTSLNRAFGSASTSARKFGDDTERESKRIRDSLGHVGRAAVTAGAAFGTAGLALGIKHAIDEARESAKVTAQTEAVIKSTGGSAKVTAGHVGEMAEKLSLLSGIDDEVIQRSGNLLLTFKDVRDEAGKGNKIFSDSQRAILDMASAMASSKGGQAGGSDLKSATIQVGKALQDPIKGLSTLSRVGVVFNDQQKKQIEHLVETGDKMGAQKIILKELRSEFGGSAKANADAMDKLKVAVNNLFERMGKHLLPAAKDVAEWLGRFIRQMERGKGAGGKFVDVMNEVITSFKHFFKWAGNAIHNVDRFGDGTRRVLKAIARWFEEAFAKAKRAVGNAIGFMLDRIADVVQAATHLPFVGDKFKDIAADIRRAADRARGLKKNIEAVPRELQVNVVLKAVTAGDIPKLKDPKDLFKGSGGPKLRRALGQMAANKWGPSLQKQADSLFVPGGPAGKAPGTLGKWEAMGHAMGLVTTSGYRPGDPGFHGSNRARDLSGSAATMLKYARLMYRTFGTSIDELIHTPLGVGVDAHRAGPLTSLYPASTLADHYDHVHIALRGGGRIPGSGSGDKVPALLEPGEHVFTKSEVKRAGGHDAMFSLRRALGGGTQSGGLGMATGGKVGPGGIPRTDWRMVKSIAAKHGVDPLLLVAIGKIETDWGRLGDGRNGNVLGVGSYDTGSTYKWAGLRNQLRKGAELLEDWGATTIEAVLGGKASSWATDPDWEGTVASKYREIATPHWRRNAQVVGDDDAGGGGTSGGISWTTKGGRVGKKTRLPEGTTFFKSGAGVRVKKGRIVARTEASAAGRERYRNRPTLGGTFTYESELAQADRILDRAGDIDPTNKRDVAAVGGKLLLLGNRKAAIKRRLRTIRKALKGRLSRSARSRLLGEQAQLISELGGIESTSRELHESMHPEAGEDTAAQAAEDRAAAERELADQIKALKESIDEQNRITSSTVAIGLREAQRALADMISGEIGGLVGQRNRSPGDGMTAARY